MSIKIWSFSFWQVKKAIWSLCLLKVYMLLFKVSTKVSFSFDLWSKVKSWPLRDSILLESYFIWKSFWARSASYFIWVSTLYWFKYFFYSSILTLLVFFSIWIWFWYWTIYFSYLYILKFNACIWISRFLVFCCMLYSFITLDFEVSVVTLDFFWGVLLFFTTWLFRRVWYSRFLFSIKTG